MSQPADEGPELNSERLVFFTDAVAAIAITLLVLPLLDAVSDAARDQPPLDDLFRDNVGEFGAFLLSFAVIFRFWWAHHQLFRHIAVIGRRLVVLTMFWTLAIVLLPIPVALVTAYDPSAATVAAYGGVLVLASGSLSLMAVHAYRHPEISGNRPPAGWDSVLGTVTVFGILVVATAVGSVFASTVSYWAFFLMYLAGPVQRVATAVHNRRAP